MERECAVRRSNHRPRHADGNRRAEARRGRCAPRTGARRCKCRASPSECPQGRRTYCSTAPFWSSGRTSESAMAASPMRSTLEPTGAGEKYEGRAGRPAMVRITPVEQRAGLECRKGKFSVPPCGGLCRTRPRVPRLLPRHGPHTAGRPVRPASGVPAQAPHRTSASLRSSGQTRARNGRRRAREAAA